MEGLGQQGCAYGGGVFGSKPMARGRTAFLSLYWSLLHLGHPKRDPGAGLRSLKISRKPRLANFP